MPIEVSTAEDLINIENNMSADYIQVADIDLSGYDWVSIGKENGTDFTGTFDGNKYKIKNLTIDANNEDDGLYSGLFYWAGNAEFKNIILEDINLDLYGGSDSGGIVGGSYETIFENCRVNGKIINGYSDIGGIVGYVEKSEIKRCTFEGIVTGIYYVGGIVGYSSSWDSSLNIDKCSSYGEISAASYNPDEYEPWGFGGIFGWSYNTVVANSYSNCDVDAGFGLYAGGLGGYLSKDGCTTLIKNSYSYGNVDGDGYTGGLLGKLEGDGEVLYSYYDKEKSGQSDTGKGKPRTTKEMTYPAADNTYEGWDFDNIWYIYDFANNGYPVLEEKQQPEDPYLLHFLETPRVKIQPPSANCVTVRSPTAKYTAEVDNLSEDKKVERLVEIDEGDQEVCKTVAEQLLERWSKELKSVSGPILLNQDLEFKKKVNIVHQEAMIEEDMTVQKLEHDIIAYRTRVTAGDIILSDEELLARILDEI